MYPALTQPVTIDFILLKCWLTVNALRVCGSAPLAVVIPRTSFVPSMMWITSPELRPAPENAVIARAK